MKEEKLKHKLFKFYLLNLIFGFFLIQVTNGNCKTIPAEKVIFKTNSRIYLAGDTIHYSAFVLSYQSYQLSKTSEILYVDVWANGKKVGEQKLKLVNGRGNGSIVIPSYVGSGHLRMVGYTNWMFNFPNLSHSQFFIDVHNPKDKVSKSKKTSRFNSLIFYPEGGHLIGGHLNTVAVRTNNTQFFNSNFKVVDSSKNIVASFDVDSLGFSEFRMLPQYGNEYRIVFNKDTLDFRFPKVGIKKASLKVIKNERAILVFANLGKSYASDSLKFIVQSKGKLLISEKVGTRSLRRIKFNLKYNQLPDGLIQLILFDDNDHKISERLLFLYKEDSLQSINIEGLSYKTNSNERITLSLANKTNKYFSGIVKIEKDEPFSIDKNYDLYFQTNLFTEIGISVLSKDHLKAIQDSLWLDMFLKTQKNRTMNFEKYNYSVKVNDKEFLQRDIKDKFVLQGKIINDRSGEILDNKKFLCTILGQKKQVYQFNTDEKGKFYLPITSFEGDSKIIFKFLNDSPSWNGLNINVILDQLQVENQMKYSVIDVQKDLDYKDKIESLVKQRSISKIYCDFNGQKKNEITEVPNGFFSNYTFKLDYSEYILLNDFEEILDELIPAIKILNKSNIDSKYDLRLFYYDERKGFLEKYFEERPLVIIDGVPIDNHDQLFEIPAKEVKNIRTINNKLFINGGVFSGLIEVETFNQNILDYPNPLVKVISYQGFHVSNSYKHFSRCNIDELSVENFPDFRLELLWMSNVELPKDETQFITSFKTSYKPGNYHLIGEFINENGNIIKFKERFLVENTE